MPNYAEMTDDELMLRYYACDDWAFAELHRRYLAELTRLACGMLRRIPGRREKAEELASDALIKAAATKRRPSTRWRPELGPVRNWLRAICYYTVLTYLRRKPGEGIVLSELTPPSDSETRRFEDLLQADDLEPLDGLLQQELFQALRECFEALPNEDRLILSLFRYGLIQTEIAGLLGVANSTVMHWRHRAYGRLAECLLRDYLAE